MGSARCGLSFAISCLASPARLVIHTLTLWCLVHCLHRRCLINNRGFPGFWCHTPLGSNGYGDQAVRVGNRAPGLGGGWALGWYQISCAPRAPPIPGAKNPAKAQRPPRTQPIAPCLLSPTATPCRSLPCATSGSLIPRECSEPTSVPISLSRPQYKPQSHQGIALPTGFMAWDKGQRAGKQGCLSLCPPQADTGR